MDQSSRQVVIGIDLGTQGVRILAVSPEGEVVATTQSALSGALPGLPDGWIEQSPQEWWEVTASCLREMISRLGAAVEISAISVDSTSGTVLPVDVNGAPLYPAIMYNDRRSEEQAIQVCQVSGNHMHSHGYRFASSFALPKILWLQQQQKDVFHKAAHFIHAADFLVGKLCGYFTVTDSSNALKTGINLETLSWPDFIETDLAIPNFKLPEVNPPGSIIGQVSNQAALETGLQPGIPIVAGATDGIAAQIASGAAQPGEWNSTLGTTLVLKGITRDLVIDPLGRLYSHRHPQGWWMPGGASNTGGEWIALEYQQADLQQLDCLAEGFLPTKLLRYPLVKNGERFPFVCNTAQGFIMGNIKDPIEMYASGMEGVAFLEKLAYEVVEKLGMIVGEKVFITGGGSRSRTWNRIRASTLERTLAQPEVTETAMGAAILAAAGSWYTSLQEAAEQMVHSAEEIEPESKWQSAYGEQYQKFKQELSQRGYLG